MKNFEMGFGLAPLPNFGHAPKNIFAQKIRAIHGIDVKSDADYEYEFYFWNFQSIEAE